MINTFMLLLFTVFMTGCANTATNTQDAFEPYNRVMYDFNKKLDNTIMKPAATAYKRFTPEPMQNGVGNFFGNINDVPTALNDALQARPAEAATDVARVIVNSTVGLGGIFDVATPAGLPKHDQDFGQTLGRWGVPSGPYVILPLLGPTTTRDALAMAVDFETDPWGRAYPVALRNIGSMIRAVDHRAYLLGTSELMEEAALDPYEFTRDAYLQRREAKIFKAERQESKPAESYK